MTLIITAPMLKSAQTADHDHPIRQQPERQHRLGGPALPCGEPGQCDRADRGQSGQPAASDLLPLAKRQHQRADPEHQQHGTGVIDAVRTRLPILVQESGDHGDGGSADRQVHPEHQPPVHLLHQHRAERRPDHRGDAPDAGEQSLDAGALGGRVDIADDGVGDRQHAAGARSLAGCGTRPARPSSRKILIARTRPGTVRRRERRRACAHTGRPAGRRSGWLPPARAGKRRTPTNRTRTRQAGR